MGVEIEYGCSWIETKNKVHALVKDRSNPQRGDLFNNEEIGWVDGDGRLWARHTNFVYRTMKRKTRNTFFSTVPRSRL